MKSFMSAKLSSTVKVIGMCGIPRSRRLRACKSPSRARVGSLTRSRYLVSWAVFQLTGQCDVSSLRSLNAGAICLVCVLAYDILRNVRRSSAKAIRQSEDWRVTLLDAHSAFNISLFPPLFFFSALYYTDVVSTLCVLQSYNVSLQSRIPTVSSTASALQALAVGTAALCFRQTNIFWGRRLSCGSRRSRRPPPVVRAGRIDWRWRGRRPWHPARQLEPRHCL